MDDLDRRKLLSVLSHGSIFFSSIAIPVVIPIVILRLSNDPVVKENAKESINGHINLLVYGFIVTLIVLLMIGYPQFGLLLLALLHLASTLPPMIAIVRCFMNPQTSYRYPFIFRLL